MSQAIRVSIVVAWIAAIAAFAVLGTGGGGNDPEGLASPHLAPEAGGEEVEQGWFGIYIEGRKVGYSSRTTWPTEEGYGFEEFALLDLALLGKSQRIEAYQSGKLDPDRALRELSFVLSAAGSRVEIEAHHEGNTLEAILRAGSGEQRFDFEVPEKLYTPSIVGPYLESTGFIAGATYEIAIFDPSAQRTAVLSLKVLGKESVDIAGEGRELWHVEQVLHGATQSSWFDDEAQLWKEQAAEGFVSVREDAERARQGIEGANLDVAQLFSVPVSVHLEDPTALSRLTLRVTGLPAEFSGLAHYRQERDGELLTIRREALPERGAYELPYNETAEAVHLAEEPLLPIGHPEIRKAANEAIGSKRDPLAAARAVNAWVYDRLRKEPVAGIPNALEALEQGRGDCNEHAALSVALARSVGIPARTAAGLVFQNGAFYYHAWTEYFVGSWVSGDAALGQFPADVTHLRLAGGSLASQAPIVNALGRIRLEVEDYE